jgi:RNA polymerase sigma factor (sigma-70 family)
MTTGGEPSDAALLEAWMSGDAQAGVALVRRHYDAVFAFHANKVGLDDAAELTQATFATLVESIERFRRQSSVRTYVFAIARWKLVEHFRRRNAQRQRFAAPDADDSREAAPVEPVATLGSWLDGRRRESLLVLALRTLPLDDQILLELKGYEDLTLRELAEVFDASVGTIASRVRRARGRLEQAIRRLADDPGLAQETLTGLDTYMRSLRALTQVP